MASLQHQSVAYYDRIAPTYDETLHPDLAIRSSFQSLVLETVPRGAVLLDFGCGTGTDAAFYAEHGYRVFAWDPSPGMVVQARCKCDRHIRAGHITILSDLESFPTIARPAAITVNFAVTSLIADLRAQFEQWARCLAAEGCLILSVQNPWYWKDVGERWWWRGLPALLSTRMFHMSGGATDLYRRLPSLIERAAAPQFRLLRRTGGRFSKFRFLVFRRCQP